MQLVLRCITYNSVKASWPTPPMDEPSISNNLPIRWLVQDCLVPGADMCLSSCHEGPWRKDSFVLSISSCNVSFTVCMSNNGGLVDDLQCHAKSPPLVNYHLRYTSQPPPTFSKIKQEKAGLKLNVQKRGVSVQVCARNGATNIQWILSRDARGI